MNKRYVVIISINGSLSIFAAWSTWVTSIFWRLLYLVGSERMGNTDLMACYDYYLSLIKQKCIGVLDNKNRLALPLMFKSVLLNLKYHTNLGNTIQAMDNVQKICGFSSEKDPCGR